MNETGTVISEDVTIEGTVTAKGNIKINGTLTGDLTCEKTSEIGTGATIKGNIESANTTIKGNVTGNITSDDKIEFKTGAKINGDIKSKRLTVEDGVTFTGHAEITPDTTSYQQNQPLYETSEEHETKSVDMDATRSGFFTRK